VVRARCQAIELVAPTKAKRCRMRSLSREMRKLCGIMRSYVAPAVKMTPGSGSLNFLTPTAMDDVKITALLVAR
jgi:hypothetical protein